MSLRLVVLAFAALAALAVLMAAGTTLAAPGPTAQQQVSVPVLTDYVKPTQSRAPDTSGSIGKPGTQGTNGTNGTGTSGSGTPGTGTPGSKGANTR
jgi:hypothetical protein